MWGTFTNKVLKMAAVTIAILLVLGIAMRTTQPAGVTRKLKQAIFQQHDSPAEIWLQKQHRRRQVLRDVCQHYAAEVPSVDYDQITEENVRLFKEVLVNEKYRVAFSPIAKVSCSSWKTLLLAMSGDFDNKTLPGNPHDWSLLKEHGWTRLHTLDVEEIKLVLKTYTKFLVVRHPYLRLHSAFSEKFQWFPNGKPKFVYPKAFGTKVIKRYWTNPTPEALQSGLNISFQDFIHFVGDPELKPSYKFDPHWMPYYLASSPCVVRYNYILKMETMAEDAERFLNDVLKTNYRLGHSNEYHQTRASAFQDIPDDIMHDLRKTYHYDLEFFGYQWPMEEKLA